MPCAESSSPPAYQTVARACAQAESFVVVKDELQEGDTLMVGNGVSKDTSNSRNSPSAKMKRVSPRCSHSSHIACPPPLSRLSRAFSLFAVSRVNTLQRHQIAGLRLLLAFQTLCPVVRVRGGSVAFES